MFVAKIEENFTKNALDQFCVNVDFNESINLISKTWFIKKIPHVSVKTKLSRKTNSN